MGSVRPLNCKSQKAHVTDNLAFKWSDPYNSQH